MPERRLRLREVERRLAAAGFSFVRQKGSHRIWERAAAGGIRTVVIPERSVLAVGTLASILRQARLTWDEFEAL